MPVVAQAVKKQGEDAELYELVNMKGTGKLIELMKKAKDTKDYQELDNEIKKIGPKFLEDNGKGEYVSVEDLVNYRKRTRPNTEAIPIIKTNWFGRGKLKKPLSAKEKVNRDAVLDSKNIHICWKLEDRGTVGETILHLCFLNSSRAHSDLAKRLILHYPKLINDIYAGDEYYGENALHMAIVNEDPAMVKFLLDNGANCRARACGNFFFPDDQKRSRTDSVYSECVEVCKNTNYEGHVYLGEYPLSFAACLGQEECVRLLVACDSRNEESKNMTRLTDLHDANGNTALHMLVIHDNKSMFDLIHSLGGSLDIKNRQGLTPLTLAAKLARKDMYEHILEMERSIFWKFGNVTCAGYHLSDIDTISTKDGSINRKSALNLIVYGEEQGHLDMMDGLVENLLREKWKTFVKYRLVRRFILFILYFVFFTVAFLLRPGKDYCADDSKNKNLRYCSASSRNGTNNITTSTAANPCYLLKPYTDQDVARLILEAIVLAMAIGHIVIAMTEVYNQGFKCFFSTLKEAPAKALYLLSCFLVLLMLPGRAACSHEYEDYMGVFAILCTAPYFLFFCRGNRIVGPFVVMIYNMVKGDLLRFFIIYIIFLIGFSQAMYIQFRHHDSAFSDPLESILAMSTMSGGEFEDFYENFNDLPPGFSALVQIIFLVYMVLVTLLLVNMLIAMMGNTYQLVASTEREWLRQWAKIVLIIEQSVSAPTRKNKQMLYSEPHSKGGRVLVVRSHQTEVEKEDDMKRRNYHKIQQKKKKKKMRLKAVVAPLEINQNDVEEGKVNL